MYPDNISYCGLEVFPSIWVLWGHIKNTIGEHGLLGLTVTQALGNMLEPSCVESKLRMQSLEMFRSCFRFIP